MRFSVKVEEISSLISCMSGPRFILPLVTVVSLSRGLDVIDNTYYLRKDLYAPMPI